MADTQYHLSYKTRGDSSPQGKPKVYFCCHPDDFGYLFEEISNEILAEQNCSVWYADPVDAVRDEEFLNDLSQMQLFVMPVTAKLLYLKNHAIDVEFPFAVEHHIPILPLMQESDLEGIFNQKCADLQFLDKKARDATAIPYEEKFRAYLSSVLIGDELAQKVRDAFDAYIFLSYRKKDRKYAQELMRLIHKNKSCRDIAIWYDEFLIPGENFNDAIRQALNKSDLFVMTVTPNLIAEKNYIMTTEYPMAKDAGKPILPAEMVKTDRGALAEKYQQLPIPTDAHNEIALSETLLSTIQNLAIKENDDSPEHSFFIGLAYLGGIDVEVDHERALFLIRSAAEAGLPEAMEKLIRMYETGEGVARDYQAAIAWREKKIARSEKIYRDSPDEASLNQFFWDVINCAYAYYSLGKSTLAYKKIEYAKDLMENAAIQEKSPNTRRNLAVCYRLFSAIPSSKRDFDGYMSYIEKSLTILEDLCRETGTQQARYDLADAYAGIIGYAKTSVRRREKAIEIAEELVRETDSIEMRWLLSKCYKSYGDFLRVGVGGNPPAARGYLEKSLAIAEDLSVETGTLQARRDLADRYTELSGLCGRLKDVDAEKRYTKKAFQLSQKIAQETDAVGDRRRLASAYGSMGLICKSEGNAEKARFYYEEELVLLERLTYETEGTQDGKFFCLCCNTLGELCKDMGDLSSSFSYYEKGIEMCEMMTRETDAESDRRSLANAYFTVARAYEKSGDLKMARYHFEKKLMIYERLILEKNEVRDRDMFCYYCGRLGEICSKIGDVERSIYYYEKEIEERKNIAQTSGKHIDYVRVVDACENAARTIPERRTAYLQKAIGIYEILCDQQPEDSYYRQQIQELRVEIQKLCDQQPEGGY